MNDNKASVDTVSDKVKPDENELYEELLNARNELVETQRIGKIGSWRLDLVTNKVTWSKELYNIYDLDPALPPPDYTEHAKLFSPESWAALEPAVAKAAETGEPYEIKAEFISNLGRRGWLLSRGEGIKDASGKVIQLRGIVIDISESKRLEMNLTRTVNDLVEAQRIGKIGNWNLDLLTGHVTWSEQLYKMFERAPSKPPPNIRETGQLFSPDSWNRLEAAIGHTAESGEPYELELVFITENKKHGWMLARGEARKDYNGKITGLQGMAIDITRQKDMEIQIASSLENSEQNLLDTVELIVNLNHMRDPYTAGHEWRVAALALAIANKMGLPEPQKTGLVIAAKLHDIGNVIVSEDILGRKGDLSRAELVKMQLHSSAGAELLNKISFPWPVQTAVKQHHERLDGSGYPDGLTGDQIILEARIIAVADTVEAMSSDRPYRPAKHLEFVLQEIINERDTTLDAEVVDACVSLFRQDGYTIPQYRTPTPLE